MKKTKKKLAFLLLNIFFSALVPIMLVILQYGNIGQTRVAIGFKVGMTGILLVIMIFWLTKRLFINSRLADMKTQANVMIADLKTKQNDAEVSALEREIRYLRTVESALSTVTPLLFLGAAILAFKALEAQIVKLSATLCLIAVSYCIGAVFNVLHAREIHGRKK